MGRVSRDARLLFIEIWTICDDYGNARGASRMLASLLFPYDSDAPDLIDGWIDELEREGCVRRYSVDGSAYVSVCNWKSHQKIDHPSKTKTPSPPKVSEVLARVSEKIPLDQGPRTKEGIEDREGTKDGIGEDPEGKGVALPTADAAGDKNPSAHVTEDSLNSGWWQFHDALKLALCNVPLGHPNFSDVVRGETDWGSCFADWRLARATRTPAGLQLHTVSPRAPTTQAGLHKYSKRIAMLAEQTFGCAVEFRVQGASP